MSWDRFEELYKVIISFLNIELFQIQSHPITVAKIFISLLIIVFSGFFSRRITKLLSKRIFQKIGVKNSSLHTLETLVFYTLVCFFVLLGLKTASIPFTIFNVIGGALAIGVGFASKEILSNFISGIIILFEKPIKVGDYLKVGEHFGKVSSIGMRSTKLITMGNRHLVVPNSKFLENEVNNWSYENNNVRISLSLGVSYSSDIDLVESIIRSCIQSHTRVLDRDIRVFLNDFADSALIFEGLFFIHIEDHLDEKSISSEIRKSIFKTFADKQVVIPFPQRDVHIYDQK